MSKNILIMGAGGFGISLAITSENAGCNVLLWSHNPVQARKLSINREDEKLLNGAKIPQEIEIISELKNLHEQDIIIIATPSCAVRETCKRLQGKLDSKTIIVCVSKGLEKDTLKLMSDIIDEELPENHNAILSGPSHAEEIAKGMPTTVVVASKHRKSAEEIQETLMNHTLRIYVSDDVIGVELGAALKNIIAMAAGVTDGLGLGDNPKAALMTRGITEIARLGVKMGAKRETFAGLAGIGDLIVTCTSMHSRNRRAGILVGQGLTPAQAVEQIGMTVEGYYTAKSAYLLSQKMQVDMPIVEQVYKVIYENKTPKEAIRDLMARPKRHESEENWISEL